VYIYFACGAPPRGTLVQFDGLSTLVNNAVVYWKHHFAGETMIAHCRSMYAYYYYTIYLCSCAPYSCTLLMYTLNVPTHLFSCDDERRERDDEDPLRILSAAATTVIIIYFSRAVENRRSGWHCSTLNLCTGQVSVKIIIVFFSLHTSVIGVFISSRWIF